MENTTVLANQVQIHLALKRLCHVLIENYIDFNNTILIGLQPRGWMVMKRINQILTSEFEIKNLKTGIIDPTFHRDDFRRRKEVLKPAKVEMNNVIEDAKVILIDDVLFTGRTIRSGIDAMMDFGRPATIELLVLVDRRYSRQLPIAPNYVGIEVDTRLDERVKVEYDENNNCSAILLLS